MVLPEARTECCGEPSATQGERGFILSVFRNDDQIDAGQMLQEFVTPVFCGS